MNKSSHRTAAELFGLFNNKQKIVGSPIGARRMSRTELRSILKKHPGSDSFSSLARFFACYRLTRGCRGLKPGSGDGYGTEFVFTGCSHVTNVVVVDPRTPTVTTLDIKDFFKRGFEYWRREYPVGWATSSAWLPFPPDCRQALYSRMLTKSSTSYTALSAAIRRYLDSSAQFNASMSPVGLFDMCVLLGGPAFSVSSREASAPLFEVLEAPICRKLLSWVHFKGVQPPGRIEAGRVVAPLKDVIEMVLVEIKNRLIAWATSITSNELHKADILTLTDTERAKAVMRKRRASSIGASSSEMPMCVSKCLYPENKTYAKNSVRYPVLSVIRGYCLTTGVSPHEVVDVDRMIAQWTSQGSKGGLSELRHGLERGKVYPVTCAAVDNAGGCPYMGNVKLCCKEMEKRLPSPTNLTPTAIWTTEKHTKKISKI